MNAVLTTTPPRVQAGILRRVIAEKHPKFALGDIAHHYDLTMDQLQAILRRYGYPDTTLMRRNASELELEAEEIAAGGPHLDEPADDDLEAAARAAQEPPTTEEADHAHTRPRLITVKVADLHTDPNNLRDNLPDIEDLADSIKEAGLMQPPVVRREGDRLIVVAGHRRLAAIRLLRWDVVDVISQGPMRPDRVIAAMLIENGQRRDLDPIEEARGLAKLKQANGCSDAELGRLIGRSVAFVSMRLALLDLTPEEQAQVRAGELKLTYAVRQGRLNAGKKQAAGQERGWHLSVTHDLAHRVKARCIQLRHVPGRKVGGIGCGECWETVIRTDERARLQAAANNDAVCPTCGSQA
jgi:ParB family transcriptional regulator, chromosome partitioning protein